MRKKKFIVDANVVIDFYNSDISILKLLSEFISPVQISKPTLAKLALFTESLAKSNKIKVVTPPDEIIIESADKKGPLAFDDHVAILLAHTNNWDLITNDKALRKVAKNTGVKTVWGLETMKLLVLNNLISKKRAINTAYKIHHTNPFFITPEILHKFIKLIKSL